MRNTLSGDDALLCVYEIEECDCPLLAATRYREHHAIAALVA